MFHDMKHSILSTLTARKYWHKQGQNKPWMAHQHLFECLNQYRDHRNEQGRHPSWLGLLIGYDFTPGNSPHCIRPFDRASTYSSTLLQKYYSSLLIISTRNVRIRCPWRSCCSLQAYCKCFPNRRELPLTIFCSSHQSADHFLWTMMLSASILSSNISNVLNHNLLQARTRQNVGCLRRVTSTAVWRKD